MKTDKLHINQLSPDGFNWYMHYLTALDTKDLELYGSFLADSCVMQINNTVPVKSKNAILAMLKEYWQSFGDLEHDLLNIYGTDSAFMLEALNHYSLLDKRTVTLRAVALTDRNQEGKVTSIRLYSDTSPLFASNS